MFIRDEKVFKVKHFCNSHNDGGFFFEENEKSKDVKGKIIYLFIII